MWRAFYIGDGREMPKVANLLLLIMGMIASGVGLAGMRTRHGAWVLLVAGLALVALACVSDRRREARREERRRLAIEKRTAQLAGQPWRPGQSLRLPQPARTLVLPPLLTLLGIGGVWLHWHLPTSQWPPLIVGVPLLALGVLAQSRILGGIGRPALELSSAGLITPLSGAIAWREVAGIFLHSVTTRRGATTHLILFRVPCYAKVVSSVHWTDRLLAVFRLGPLACGRLAVILAGSKEPPQAVYALARHLWKQQTGNDYEWNPFASDAVNEALRRTGTYVAHMREPGAVEAALADLSGTVAASTQLTRDMALIAGERKRQLARAWWIAGAFVLIMLLRVAWPWLEKALHP
jgi:hypothetical protein